MKFTLISLCLFTFSVIYPLCFWINIKNRSIFPSAKFHLGLTNMSAGIAVVLFLFTKASISLKIILILWKALLIFISRKSWKKNTINKKQMSFISILGICILLTVESHLINLEKFIVVLWIFLFLILCLVLYLCINLYYQISCTQKK